VTPTTNLIIPALKIKTFLIERKVKDKYKGDDYSKFLEEQKRKNEELLGN